MEIDLTVLRQLLSYSPDTGRFTWIKSNRGLVGCVAGSMHHSGYRQIRVQGRVFLEHRLVWAFHHGRMPDTDLDHIDRDKTNNKISNLRRANDVLNSQNKGVARNNKSGVRGVHWHKAQSKWIACIRVNRKLIQLGRFDSLEDAKSCYSAASKKYHPFANTVEDIYGL